MSIQLKPLHKQVMFITGASSGIGLTTARLAAEHGTKVVLVARNEEALQKAAAEITDAGGNATYAVADVADSAQLRQAAEKAVKDFGRIDTWVNNAGVGMFGRIQEVDVSDDRRLFETNFWGVVNGCRLAAEFLKDGGALINLGSEVSDIAVNVQGMYSASKHAVLGFTDAYRIEIEEAKLPISLTLIKPAAINTPFPRHAKNYSAKESTLPSPVYAPELVADQILHAATHPSRELYVGGSARLLTLIGQHFPQLADWVMAKTMGSQQHADRPANHENESLHESRGYHEERGDVDKDHLIREHSAYGVASRHPLVVTMVTAAAGAAVAYLFLRSEPKPKPTLTQRAKQMVRDHAGVSAQRIARAARDRTHDLFN